MISIVSDFATEVSQVLEIIQACRKAYLYRVGLVIYLLSSLARHFGIAIAVFVLVLASLPALALATPAVTRGPLIRSGSFQSTNWSGYAVTGPSKSVTDAKGSWIVPAITGTCPSTNQYSSHWVGIDGFSSNTVEQTGTDSDCQNGAPTYYAWYEFYPHPSFLISGLTIRPLDVISAEV